MGLSEFLRRDELIWTFWVVFCLLTVCLCSTRDSFSTQKHIYDTVERYIAIDKLLFTVVALVKSTKIYLKLKSVRNF